MPEFESISELETYLYQELDRALLIISERVKNLLRNNLIKYWYNRSSYYGSFEENKPWYKRTFQLINAIQYKKTNINGVLGIEVFVNDKDLQPTPKENGFYYNSYMNLNRETSYGGRSVASWVVEWIDQGNKFLVGSDVTRITEDEINTEIESIMRETLNSFGISTD